MAATRSEQRPQGRGLAVQWRPMRQDTRRAALENESDRNRYLALCADGNRYLALCADGTSWKELLGYPLGDRWCKAKATGLVPGA